VIGFQPHRVCDGRRRVGGLYSRHENIPRLGAEPIEGHATICSNPEGGNSTAVRERREQCIKKEEDNPIALTGTSGSEFLARRF
jgi:hypothetical protein